MSSHDDKEELIEHQYEHNNIPNGAAPAVAANEAAVLVVDGEAIETRITGFRDYLLTSEFLKTIRHLEYEWFPQDQTLVQSERYARPLLRRHGRRQWGNEH